MILMLGKRKEATLKAEEALKKWSESKYGMFWLEGHPFGDDIKVAFLAGRESLGLDVVITVAKHHHGGICRVSKPCTACLIEQEIRRLIEGENEIQNSQR